jgi:ribonuclease D
MLKPTIDKETLNELPKGEFKGTIKVITRPEEVTEVLPEIVIHNKLGFDTESKPAFHKGTRHGIALLQLSSADTAWLFRLHETGFTPGLAKLMADPNIKKVGAAILDDVRGLKKHLKFEPAGFIDLQKHVDEFGVMEKGVKKMAAIFLGIKISKRQRLTNWEATKLSEAQLRYAATDAWICLKIYERMLAIKNNGQ